MSKVVPDRVPSPETLIVQALPERDRELLRQGAVLRYITHEYARAATGSDEEAQRLLAHPLVHGDAWGRQEQIWEIPLPLRQELLKGWDDKATKILEQVAKNASSDDDDPLYSRLYARLASARERPKALRDLETEVASVLAGTEPDVGRAHDLLRLLDEWPIDGDDDAKELRDEKLGPQVHRFARGARDREATRTYLERPFEKQAIELLLDDTPQWMLQIHAPAGRGKTMFLRHFLGRFCPQHNIPIARIDFDYVAHVPIVTQEPWRVLLAIARQLDPQLPNSPFRFLLDSYGQFQALLFSEALPIRRETGEIDDVWHADMASLNAEEEVPRKFRAQLASAVRDGHVVVVLDTLENVLHTEGASIDTLLAALGEVRNGRGDSVPGLRVVLSGRFDLQGTRTMADGYQQPRAKGFEETWVGPTAYEVEDVGDTTLRIGREVLSVEIPAFSSGEARTYLEQVCGLQGETDDALLAAIAKRCDGNPMKLALFAEQVRGEPPLTVEDVEAFESVDLFFLVDRIVDRIADEHVQWLLRWGVLPHVLTRSFADTVIWRALENFAASRSAYDDPDKDNLPASRHEITRWKIPDLKTIQRPGASRAAWNGLLEYAADASWVAQADDLPDAVVFHPDVRDPLRHLLRKGQHPAYDDMHRRSLAYWMERVEETGSGANAVAIRGVMFHAYQPWHGDRPSPAEVWRDLVRRFALDRTARGEVAAEILQAARGVGDDQIEGPMPEDVALAHLELGERLVHEAVIRGMPVDEVRLLAHLEAAKEVGGVRSGRRWWFLRAVLSFAGGDDDRGWDELRSAMDKPSPDAVDAPRAHLDLVVSWLSTRTPPVASLDVVDAIRDESRGMPFEYLVHASLSRGLIAAERWSAALDIARAGGNKELEARALLGLGYAREVLTSEAYPKLRRAEAALLRYEPEVSDRLIGPETDAAQALMMRGKACILRTDYVEAMSFLSSAAAGKDHLIAAQALLDLGRLLIDTGQISQAEAELRRLPPNVPQATALRRHALEAVATQARKEEYLLPGILEAMRKASDDSTVPPSVLVEIELARLEIGHAVNLVDLTEALARMKAAGSRLIALRGLSRIVGDAVPYDAPGRLVELCSEAFEPPPIPDWIVDEPTMVLGVVELLRVTGRSVTAQRILEDWVGDSDLRNLRNPSLNRAIDSALERCYAGAVEEVPAIAHGVDVDPLPPYEEPLQIALFVASGPSRGAIRVKMNILTPDAHEFHTRLSSSETVADGAYALASQPDAFFGDLGQALLVEYLDEVSSAGWHHEILELWIEDEDVARLPWELATHHKVPLCESGAVVRRVEGPHAARRPYDPAESPGVAVTVGVESKDRGHTLERLFDVYSTSAKTLDDWKRLPVLDSNVRVVHLVAEMAQRRRGAGLLLRGSFVTARNLGECLGDGIPRLLVLDLALHPHDVDAAEQLLLANSFCWTLCRAVPTVSVICGVFAAANDRVPQLYELGRGLTKGADLVEVIGSLQRFKPKMPLRRDHPLRSAVALVSAAPRQRFVLMARR